MRLSVADASKRATLTVPEAGQVLGIGRNASYRAAANGEIPTLTIGRRILVPTARLLELLGETDAGSRTPPARPRIPSPGRRNLHRCAS